MPASQTSIEFRDYGGIRLTADGFDCALPVSIDSFSLCSYDCLYCFAQNLIEHRAAKNRVIGRTPIKRVEKLFDGQGGGKDFDIYRRALKYPEWKAGQCHKCPVQLGALADPMDKFEQKTGWLLELIDIAIKHEQPVRISTKGDAGSIVKYLDAFSKRPELFWVSFSINSIDDKVIRAVDRRAPTATERLEAMKALSAAGVTTSLRMRPMFPGISDATRDHPHAYAELIHEAKKAGAKAISYECGFLDGRPSAYLRQRYLAMQQATGVPYMSLYKRFGRAQACQRPSVQWTEFIMNAVHDVAKREGLWQGVSDPTWKQLGEHGCCCGIPADHPWFGNWQKESATNQLLIARDNPGRLIGPEDVVPAWADDMLLSKMVNLRVGPDAIYEKRHRTWGDKLRSIWNSPNHERGPRIYFQGALEIDHVEDCDYYYRYKGIQRSGKTSAPYWKINPLEDFYASIIAR